MIRKLKNILNNKENSASVSNSNAANHLSGYDFISNSTAGGPPGSSLIFSNNNLIIPGSASHNTTCSSKSNSGSPANFIKKSKARHFY
jgi:hypothetical protein